MRVKGSICLGYPIAECEEPPLWFHDILRADGTPFSKDEIRVIKELTRKN